MIAYYGIATPICETLSKQEPSETATIGAVEFTRIRWSGFRSKFHHERKRFTDVGKDDGRVNPLSSQGSIRDIEIEPTLAEAAILSLEKKSSAGSQARESLMEESSMLDIRPVVQRILSARSEISSSQSLLVAISGIDASGKGYSSRLIVQALEAEGLQVAEVNLDRWMTLPSIRFGQDRPGEHFYRHGFRFEELFETLILPLKRNRSVAIEAQALEEPATEYFTKRYEFDEVDVIILEGVFLIQPSFRGLYDLTVWVECSFETAIERAILRGQEGLPPDETVQAFETIYFPAEEYHFTVDDPKANADLILINDPRLEPAPG